MILSFHPVIEADENIICAGREPNAEDLTAIKSADAIILPQGCGRVLYELSRSHCRHVFPNYDVRFGYPGKIGQIKLFRKNQINHPRSEIFSSVSSYRQRRSDDPKESPFGLPFVFKFDWGGEGDTVYLIDSEEAFREVLAKARDFENAGQAGFLIQEYIPHHNKVLRIAIIGTRIISYWRVQKHPGHFATSLAKGGVVDAESDPFLQQTGKKMVAGFAEKTGINLAGFDVLSSPQKDGDTLWLLEINYFFGRRGLGGSEAYYRILQDEIQRWLSELGLQK
jgi:ribosomal protein S6--L-glutamate ligase